MYCPVNNDSVDCPSRCCRLYNIALAFLAAIVLFVLGLIIGVRFVDTLTSAVALLITAAVILFIIFIVTLLTKSCCNNGNGS